MRRLLCIFALATTVTSLGSGCRGRPTYVIDIAHDGKTIATCRAKELTELTPEGGGYNYACEGGGSFYFIQDTSVAKDGSLISIDVSTGGNRRSLRAAVYASSRGDAPCPSARALNRTTGEKPIPAAATGTYTLEMADPCGTVTVTVSEAP